MISISEIPSSWLTVDNNIEQADWFLVDVNRNVKLSGSGEVLAMMYNDGLLCARSFDKKFNVLFSSDGSVKWVDDSGSVTKDEIPIAEYNKLKDKVQRAMKYLDDKAFEDSLTFFDRIYFKIRKWLVIEDFKSAKRKEIV